MARRNWVLIVLIITFQLSIINCFAQLQVTPNNNAAQLAGTLAGPGVTVSGATLNCPSKATPANNPSGTFVGTASNLGIAGGVLLTTGDVQWAVGPNNSPSAGADNLYTFNDPDLMAIDPNLTNDVCILEFNATPTCSTLAFTFSFGSEEYPEFVNSFNDGFGIFVTGANPSGPNYTGYNMALLPPPAAPPNNIVSINNVNNGNYNCPGPPAGPCKNCAYYIDNCSGTTIQYDAFTSPITVTLNVVPCSNYHFKLAVADAIDGIYDTGVFFAMQSLVCATTLTVTATSTPSACSANNGTATVTSVTGGASPYTYSWSNGQTTSTAINLAPGNYTVTAIDHNGCLSGTQTVTVTNNGGFTTTSSQINVTCFGSNNGSATVTAQGGNIPYTYSWSTNPIQTTPTVSNVPAGNYTVIVTDATGCTQTATYTIIQPPVVTGSITNSTNVSCFGGNNGSATANGNGGTGTLNYSWNTNPTQNSPTASNLMAGNYIVTIKDVNGCTITQSITITQPGGMTISTSSTPSSCGMKNGTVSVIASGGATPYTYLWLTNPVQTTPIVSNLGSGTYTVIVSDANGCTQLQSASVGGGIPPVANFNFNPDPVSLLDPVVVFTDGSSGNPTVWIWNFGDNGSPQNTSAMQNPIHTYSDTGRYCISLVVSDSSGICKDSIVKCIEVQAPYTFYIPNSFSPNNDGKNELFYGYGTCIKDFHILIFDRWGNKIFESYDILQGWNGAVNNKGNLVQEDVYVWKVTITDIYGKEHKYIGRVTLLR